MQLLIDEFLANSNGSGVIAILLPAVTGSVTTTASKMQFCQKEELVWHHVIGIGHVHGFGLGTPVYCNTSIFVTWTISMSTWSLMISVWHERKQAIGICVAVFKLDYDPVGFEALCVVVTCHWCWEDAKKDVILHEVIFWSSVTRVPVDQNTKINVVKIWMGLNKSVRLAAVVFFLQLQQNIFLVLEEGVDNLLSIWSESEATRKEIEATPCNVKFTVYLNRSSIWQWIDFVHAAHRSESVMLDFLAALVALKG